MHGYRNVTPNPNFTIFLFPDTFWGKPYPLQQTKRGGWKFAPKGLSAWAFLLNKHGAFLKTLETRFLATTWVSVILQYAPKACPVKFHCLECWGWAVVGSNSWGESKFMQYSHRYQHLFKWNQLTVCQTHLRSVKPHLQTCSELRGCFREFHYIVLWFKIMKFIAKIGLPRLVHFFRSFANSPAKRGVQNRTFTPDPRTYTKLSPILLQTPPGKLLAPEGSFWKSPFWQGFHPAHLGTSRHKLSMQSCSVRSRLRSCILRIGWELWGKNSHRNG